MSSADERRRIQLGPSPADGHRLTDRVEFAGAHCVGVIERAKSVLLAVLDRTDSWPPAAQWGSSLPAWFVDACAAESTREESDAWLERWRALPLEAQAIDAERTEWTLNGWLYWFDPADGDRRGWRWWNAGTDDAQSGWVEVEVDGYPYPSGSLRWLLRAAGATHVT